MRERIIIDADPGQDDALAILLALAMHEKLDVLSITTVAGNVPLLLTTANALRILDLAGRPDVPVYAGAEAPLLFPLETAEFVCGPDGLAGSGLPHSQRNPSPLHAVDAMIAVIRQASSESITLCALGPLTNLALALRMAPDIAPRIKRIVLMGGAMGLGNMTPAAEFNIHVDPHAAAVVFGAGIPVVMIGLHLTLKAICPAPCMQRLAALDSATGKAVHGMLTRSRPGGLGTVGHPMHDPCVIAWLLWPELFSGRECHVDIETSAGAQRGRTTIDWNNRLKQPPNALVLDTVDVPVLFDRMVDALATLP